MPFAAAALWLMVIAYGAGAAFAVLALPHRLIRIINGVAGGLAVHLDRLGAVFMALVAGVSLPAAIYGVAYTAAYEERYSLRLFGLMFNGFLAGMSLVPCAGNVFSFLLAWELMAVTSYFLVMTESDGAETRTAGQWYIAMTHAGFLLLLP